MWEKLLGINFDYKLKFAKHIEGICKKASRKLNAIARLTPYMASLKKSILINAFFKLQFNYCPLIRMCRNRSLSNTLLEEIFGVSQKIGAIHEIRFPQKIVFWSIRENKFQQKKFFLHFLFTYLFISTDDYKLYNTT